MRSRSPVSNAVTLASDGLPHTPAELNAWYLEPPTGENAARFFGQGFEALQIENTPNLPLLGKARLPPPAAPISAPMKSALAALLKSNGDALQLFREGAKWQQSRYPVDLSGGYDAVLPHLPQFTRATHLVELSAILHAKEHDGDTAARDVLTVLALVRSLEAEPSLLSQFMRAARIADGMTALEHAVNRATLSADSLGVLVKTLRKMEDYDARGEGFNRGIAAERVNSMVLLQAPQEFLQKLTVPGGSAFGMRPDERTQIVERLQKARDLKDEQLFYEETFRQLMAARSKAFPDRLRTGNFVHQQVQKATDKKHVVAAWLLQGLAVPTMREAVGLAQVRLGLTAIALEQFRAEHDHHYPASLSDLTPTPPVDPFDGQPLRYRRKGNGYVLYSIGPDLKDDSGERSGGKDIVFGVVNPK